MTGKLTNSNNHSPTSDEENELLILYIEISENNTQVLAIYDSDNIDFSVSEFCKKHGIGPCAQAYLQEEVEKNLAYYYPPDSPAIEDHLAGNKNTENLNKGTDLYSKGLKLRERTEIKKEKIRTERSFKESQNATFRPKVNSPERRKKPPEQILTEKGKQTIENLNKKRTEQASKLMEDCSFSPVINKNSGKMKKSLMRSPDRFSSLYQDAKSIQDKLQKKSEELNKISCPFEPNFKKTKKKNTELLDKPSRCSTQERRDSEFKIIYNEKTESPKKESPKKVTERSEKMIKKIKRLRFEEIFNQLLPDSKGKIFSETVYKSKLDQNLKKIIKPIFEKLERKDEQMNFEEFCKEMEEVFKAVSPGEKGILLKTGKKREPGEELYKKPRHKRPNSCISFYGPLEESFRSLNKYY